MLGGKASATCAHTERSWKSHKLNSNKMRAKRFLFTLVVLICGVCASFAQEVQTSDDSIGDWDLFIESIITVESGGNVNARNGNCLGVLQMMPVCVKAVNAVCKENGNGKRFSLNDRRSREKSIEMFKILQDKYNPTHDFRKACNLWNGGSVKRNCSRYYNRVMKVYDRLKKKKNN